jgi:VCBS repeat-containing protein
MGGALSPATSLPAGTFAINSAALVVPWKFTNKTGKLGPAAQEFFEVGLDLNEVFQKTTENLPDFSSFIITSRTSTSKDASLSDFILGDVSSAPNVSVAKKADAETVIAGGMLGYTVTVRNIGVADVAGVTLVDDLPPGVGGDLVWTLTPVVGDTSVNPTDVFGNPVFKITGAGPGGQKLIFAAPGGQALPLGSKLVAHMTATSSTQDLGWVSNTAHVNLPGEGGDFLNDNDSRADILVVNAADDSYPPFLAGTLQVSGPGVLSNDGPLTGFTVTSVLVIGPTHGTLYNGLGTDGSFTYTPAGGYTGTDTFTYKDQYKYIDADNVTHYYYSNIATVYIGVTNTAPVAQNGTLTTAEDTPKTGTLVATDSDLNTLTYSLVSNVTAAEGAVTINPTTGAYSYSPALNYNGTASFTFKANDGLTDGNTAKVTITVTPVNDAPVAVDDATSTNEEAPKNLTQADLKGNDGDVDNTNEELSVTQVSNATNGSVVLNLDGTVTFTPTANFNGTAGFDYTLSDGALTDTGHVSVTVDAVNDAPANVSVNGATLDENGSYSLSGSFTDLESGDTHTVTISWGDGATDTVINLGSGATSFASSHQYLDDNPTATAADNYTVTVTVTDNSLGAGAGGATVTVNNVAPIIVMSTGTIALSPDDAFSRPGSFSDVGTIDTWTVTVDYGDLTGAHTLTATTTQWGVRTGKTFSLTSPAYTAGDHTVTVTVTDDDGGVDTKEFHVLVGEPVCLLPQ